MGKGKNKIIEEEFPAGVAFQIDKFKRASELTEEETLKAETETTEKPPEENDKPQETAGEKQESEAQTEAKEAQEKPKNERKRKSEEEKRSYRINLALRMDIGEEVKRMADAENRSVNNYIEQLILDHLKNRKEKP